MKKYFYISCLTFSFLFLFVGSAQAQSAQAPIITGASINNSTTYTPVVTVDFSNLANTTLTVVGSNFDTQSIEAHGGIGGLIFVPSSGPMQYDIAPTSETSTAIVTPLYFPNLAFGLAPGTYQVYAWDFTKTFFNPSSGTYVPGRVLSSTYITLNITNNGSMSGAGTGSKSQVSGDVTLTNLTGTSATIFTVGDKWQITVADPQAPNTNLWILGGQNGNTNNTNPACNLSNVCSTDSNGNFVMTGTMDSTTVGQWLETWKVGATSANTTSVGTLSFVVQTAGGSTSSGTATIGQPVGFTTSIKGDGTALTTQKQLIDAMNNLESTYLTQYQSGSGINQQIEQNILNSLTVPASDTGTTGGTSPLGTTGGTTGGAANVCTATSPTPLVANLQTGDFGDEVYLLTQVLVTDGEMKATQGIFDQTVFNAVVAYQNKYASQILTPAGLTQGTGFVGTLTKNYMNSHWCAAGTTSVSSGTVGTVPVLSGASFAVNGAGQDIVTVTGSGFNGTASQNQINIGPYNVPASSVVYDTTTGAATAITANVSSLNLGATSYSVTVTNLGL
jgi:hypothetical protein